MMRSNKLNLNATGLALILGGVFLVTLRLTFYFVNKPPTIIESTENIRLEIIKSLLEILVVTIIGSAVAALFKVYERNQEEIKIRTQLKLDFIKRIGQLYRVIKRIRRTLRTQGIKMREDETKLLLRKEQIDFYSKQMEELNDVQLEIEGLKTGAENSFLFQSSELIAEHLWKMESYLNKIISEFENKNPELQRDGQGDLAKLEFLREFTSGAWNTLIQRSSEYRTREADEQLLTYGFKREFSMSYGKILKNLK